MKRVITIAALAVALGMTTGCQTRMGDFTFASTKNIELNRMGSYERTGQRVVGEDYKPIILFFNTGMPNAEEAADNAIESVPGGVALENVVVTMSWWYIPLIYGRYIMEVEGNVIVDPALK